MDPTLTTWTTWWLPMVMGVPAADMPDATTLQSAYDTSLNLALPELQLVPSQPTSPTVYAIAVYNLGGDVLAETAQDIVPSTYWNDLRKNLGVNDWSFGIINSASDQGTSQGMQLPDYVNGLTMFDLQLSKTPWGRRYLQIAGEWGAVWGLSV
jgi:hypothetical protein